MSAIAWIQASGFDVQIVCSECGPFDYLALKTWGKGLERQAQATCTNHQAEHQQQRRATRIAGDPS